MIPISALKGANVVDKTDAMQWYAGPTLLDHLETIELAADRNLADRRFPVQWVIRPMADDHHDYRGYAGQVAGGIWRAGDAVVVLPSGHRSTVASVETSDGPIDSAIPGQSATILLADDIDVSRGDLLADPDNLPVVAREVTARVCWMSERPVEDRARVLVKHTTRTVAARIDEIVSIVDIATLEDKPSPGKMELNDLGVVRFRLAEPLAIDAYARTARPGRSCSSTRPRTRRSAREWSSMPRKADPYRDTDVIDSRAPRTNQAVVGLLSAVAVATGWWWLLALLALQLALGLTFGRRVCLACVFYFEVLQPRFGEGPLEDSRPPRAANIVGLVVLTAASVAYAAGAEWLGAALGVLVAALALLAAVTGFCTGCEAYKLGCRLTGKPFVSCPIPGASA